MGALQFKLGVRLDRLSWGGAAILGALCQCALRLDTPLTVTSGCDGTHSGPQDPHLRGDAIDIRSHDLSAAATRGLIQLLLGDLAAFTHTAGGDSAIVPTSGGWATELFFVQLENQGGPEEHIHCQVRKGHRVLAQQGVTV